MPQSRAERKLRRRIDEAAQLFGAGDVDGAKKSLETLLAKSPTIFRHEVHHHLASIARELGDGKSAIAHLGRAAKVTTDRSGDVAEAWHCESGFAKL